MYNNYSHGFNQIALVGAAHNVGALSAEILFENNIISADKGYRLFSRMESGSSSVPVPAKAMMRGTLELNGAFTEERLPNEVFRPPYSYLPAAATMTLRDDIVLTAGWQNIPLPE